MMKESRVNRRRQNICIEEQYAFHVVFCKAKHKQRIKIMTQVFENLAGEIVRKIKDKELDPRNETLGIKIGTYKSERSENEKRYPCC